MPSALVHRPIAAAAGGGWAYANAHHLPPMQAFLETVGGVGGGYLGGAAPDWIDPPISPRHRHYGHGVVNVWTALALSAEAVAGYQQRLRAQADAFLAERAYLTDDWARLWNWLQEMFLRFLVGVLNGFVAGYLSHLALDACTPQGLNFIGRGC